MICLITMLCSRAKLLVLLNPLFFSGSITHGRLNLIVAVLNFKVGALPFNYLGVPIFRGKPKSSHLQPIADKISSKLTAWKAPLLSMAGRVQLLNLSFKVC
jgi:hypothetical protein